MRTIDRSTTSLTLGLPAPGDPATLAAYIGRRVYATGSRYRDCRRKTEEYVLPLKATYDAGTQQVTLTDFAPDKMDRGVWVLIVQTDCGCYATHVYYDCNATPDSKPHHIPTHQPTSGAIPVKVDC